MPDVQDKSKQPQERQLSPREAAMEAVAQTRRNDFEKETGIHIESDAVTGLGSADPDADPDDAAVEAERQRLQDVAEGKIADTSSTQTPEQQAQAQADAEQAAREQAARDEAAAATARAQQSSSLDPAAKIKLRVNGQDVELSGEEAMRRLQKDVSADVRLEQASHERREAERIRREAEELQRSLQSQPSGKAGGETDDVVVDPTSAQEFTTALFAGDAEKATQAFNKAVSSAVAKAKGDAKGRGDATPVNPAEIAAQVRQQIAIDSALERSKQDYPQLYADPDIEAVAATKINRMVQGGKPFTEALTEVQTDMATKFGWKAAKPGTPLKPAATDRRQEKLAAKQELDTPNSTSVKSGTTEEPVTTVHDTIREMAKQRGQSV